MTKKFVFRSNKYNITHQDIQRGIEDRGYIDQNPLTSNQTNPLDKWYKYGAGRDDTNIFPSPADSSIVLTRAQVHDSIARLYESLKTNIGIITFDKERNYHVGFNFDKEKIYNLVEEQLLLNPQNVIDFTKDPNQFILSISDISIKNILIYEGGQYKTNMTMPLLKTNIGEKVGHHKDGKFERGLQGPFTEHNVGGYKHRHQKIGTTVDRPERFKITDDGTTITFSSPISGASVPNNNIPYVRFSRDGFVKAVYNIRNIKASDSNVLGNFVRNYQVINGLHRKNQNLAFVDQQNNFSTSNIDNPYLTGTTDRAVPDRRLLDGTYNKSVYVNKFGAPGDIQSTSPIYVDANSEEYSPYNTINYRNLGGREALKAALSRGSYFGGYYSGSWGLTGSYKKDQRNNRYIPISGSTIFRLRPDNAFINYAIPARDGGFSWIKNYAVSGNNPGLYINGVDNDIRFITASSEGYWMVPIQAGTYTTYTTNSVSPSPTNGSSLRYYNVQFGGLWNYTPKKQLSQNYNPIIVRNKKQNYYADYVYDPLTNKKADIRFKDSFLKDKHTNIVNVYIDDKGGEERLSFPFGQEYGSLTSDFYRVQTDQNINIYSDYRNIRTADKSRSLFSKLYAFNKYVNENNLKVKKIKKIILEEKIYPRSQNVYRNFARIRNAYSQNWADSLDNRLTQLTNSQGQVYARNLFLNKDSTNTYNFSYWPMDANEDPLYAGAIVRDKSGELVQLDNINFYNTAYGVDPGLLVPSGSYFGARFGRNWNKNRPANVVHEQAGRGPFVNSYEQFYSDIKLIGQDCSVVPEYRISPRLEEYYRGNSSYYDSVFNSLELTGTIIEDISLSVSTSSAFLEQRVNSDYIDLNEYINKEASDYKLNTIKIKVKGVKKFLPYDGFYPQQRMLKLANQFSSSYNQFLISAGSQATFRTALAPFYAPGIGFNSIKAGVGMPYSIAVISGTTAPILITSSIDTAASYYYKLPWDAILYPQKRIREISSTITIYDIDPDMTIDSTAYAASNTAGQRIIFDYSYDYMANNFYSEVINFFKNTSKLTSLQSQPSNQWYFPDLNKKYAMDIIINKEGDFYTYSSFENFGPKPYAFHAPPWHTIGSYTAITTGYNSDVSKAPNDIKIAGETHATIVFDPASLAVGDLNYFVKGQFNIGDVLRNSTISYSSTILSNNTSSATIQIGDIVDLFSVSADGTTWQPKLKWECPTANLNFNGLSAKLTNSVGNDSGDSVAGNAIRGIWHQYAPISNNNDGLFLSVRNSRVDTTLTGSLLDVVGFDKSFRGKIGEIASARRIVEGLVVIPYYLDNCGEEKYFDIDIDLFERLYSENAGIVGEVKAISRTYVLPPQIDFIKFRDQARKKLEKDEYKSVKSPFIMFPFEFSSTLTQQDLADIWQGVLPASANIAEVDYQEKEFFIGNYLKELNFKLPDNTRFKIFKVKKRAVVNYEEINYKSLGYAYSDTSYGYNWPYDFFSLLEMAEVKAELTYDTEIVEDSKKTKVSDLGAQIQRAIQEATMVSTSEMPQTTTTTTSERIATNSTGVTELNTPTATAVGTFDFSTEGLSTPTATSVGTFNFSTEGLSTPTATSAGTFNFSSEGLSTSTVTSAGRINLSTEGLSTSTTTTATAPSSTSMLGGTGNTTTSTTTNTRQ